MNEARFVELALENPVNREILKRVPSLGPADAWLVSGSLFQTAWNALTGRAPGYGIKDYDIFYFDPDTSRGAEDGANRRCTALFEDIGAEVELRNQARVHLWYEEKFGTAYPPLRSPPRGHRPLPRPGLHGWHRTGRARLCTARLCRHRNHDDPPEPRGEFQR
ncbi:MAG: hypothetical protein AMXMBFR74_16410 [Parvibaculum sp.]